MELECVEIARRILASGLPFDACSVLLRSPGRYQPLIEDAFRRAGIEAWFTRGTVRTAASITTPILLTGRTANSKPPITKQTRPFRISLICWRLDFEC
jgi:hypothetical protein